MLADETIDVRDKICPLPVLLVQRKLRIMRFGEVLEIVVDYPTSKNNILRYLKDHGHEILEVVDNDTQHNILVRKRSP